MLQTICWDLAWGAVFPCDAKNAKASDQPNYLFKLSIDIRTLVRAFSDLVSHYKIHNEMMAGVVEETVKELKKALEILKEDVTEDDSKSVRT